jgi:hypothetical protein
VITLLSLGRPDSLGDVRALQLGLRAKSVARIVREYLDALAPFLDRCQLALPDGAALGLELPAPRKS